MRTFPCQCGNTLFFDSTTCVKCNRSTGLCPTCTMVVALADGPRGRQTCSNPKCRASLIACENREPDHVCNRMVKFGQGESQSGGGAALCDYCSLTSVIPDLSVDGNLLKWTRLEQAKRRVLYVMDEVGLPFRPTQQPGGVELTFEFLADDVEPATTGHADGTITINIAEADSVAREQARVEFGEPQRTLVGHFRHELGHFIWDRMIKGQHEKSYRSVFGDERSPTYEEALEHYYKHGPKANWQQSYISAYATMHSWEDFAESFAAYLDLVTVIATAHHFGIISEKPEELDDLVVAYRKVGLVANELNRDMGLLDLVPEVIAAPVIEKLRFVHDFCREKAE